ncbi:MBOAT family O-acyltransferase [Enterococcus sp. LJL128]
MVFSSMTFLCVFLPVLFILYYLVKGVRLRNFLLIGASLLFYAYGEPVYIVLMIISTLINYFFGLLLVTEEVKKRKLALFFAVLINLGLLGVFKYSDMAVETVNGLLGTAFEGPGLKLPIGISFYTFQAMSYVIDVYRKDVAVQKNYFNILLYISFFPQLIAGPIVKYHDIQEQIDNRHADPKRIARGFRRFTIGLSKKILISNAVAIAADAVFAFPFAEINIISAWIGAIAYALQIYFDFSGYSDMAIGLGHMFGFHFLENFDYPYVSRSIKEFWRRWHISLSTWFKEYLYYPLGGNRKGKTRTVLNKWIVFFSTGLWHGASWTFVIWGLWHGLFQMIEEFLPVKRLPRLLGHIYALLVVFVGFVLFRAESFQQGLHMIGQMFTGFHFTETQQMLAFEQLTPIFILATVVGMIISMPILPNIQMRIAPDSSLEKVLLPMTYISSIILLVLCMLSLSSGTYNPFIYFRF